MCWLGGHVAWHFQGNAYRISPGKWRREMISHVKPVGAGTYVGPVLGKFLPSG